MCIGIDFDNTIAVYDHVFLAAAKQWQLLPENFHGGKKQLRDAIRTRPNGELHWQRLQGYVYGKQIQQAQLFPGVSEFLLQCKLHQTPVFIISHKTEVAQFDEDHTNLRDAATAWMSAKGFFETSGFAIKPGNVFFHDTRKEKLARVKEIGCEVFIDDLVEIFLDPDFPPKVRKILFDPARSAPDNVIFQVFNAWHDIRNDMFHGR